MGTRNYGLGSRDLARAGGLALIAARERGDVSHSTVETNTQRWTQFVRYIRDQGVRRMEHISAEHVQAYAAWLREAGKSAKTQQNAISAVNAVMRAAAGHRWHNVRPVADAGCDRATEVRTVIPVMTDRATWSAALDALQSNHGERAAAVAELARELGLRAKEASLGSPRTWARQLERGETIRIERGTKGGRPRELVITRASQRNAIAQAARIQGRDRSMIPRSQTWNSWKQGGLRNIAQTLGPLTGEARPIHSLRAAYATERYTALTGQRPVGFGGPRLEREVDRAARLTVSAELGHNRADVAAAYIGGAR